MDFLKSVGNHIVNAFRFPKPYNWGYPVFFGSVGMGLALLLLKLMFSGAFEFSSTSLIGCAVIVIVIVMFAFVAPSVLLAEKGGLCITGRYTGIGALILSFLSGAPVFLLKSSIHNITAALWLRFGGSVVFPAVFYHVEGLSGQTLILEILIDTIIPGFGFSLFFLGAVWQGFSEQNRRWAYFFIPLFFAAFSFDFLDIFAILIIGWCLCIVRNHTENIYGPILTLLGARITGILIDNVVFEVDLTTVRVYSDIPSTFYFASIPAISSGVRRILPASKFAFRRSILRDPGMGTINGFLQIIHASESCACVQCFSSAIAARRSSRAFAFAYPSSVYCGMFAR
jgi:hypothetical protein